MKKEAREFLLGMFSEKRALSEVVSTIIIIFLSIVAAGVLFVVVLNLLNQKNIENQQEALNCIQGKNMDILGSCYEGNLLKITLKNNREITLGDFFLVEIEYSDGTKEALPTPYHTYLNPYSTGTIIVPYKKDIDRLRVIPKIESSAYLCIESAPEYELIKPCVIEEQID